jgi:hypothetical protein
MGASQGLQVVDYDGALGGNQYSQHHSRRSSSKSPGYAVMAPLAVGRVDESVTEVVGVESSYSTGYPINHLVEAKPQLKR